mmetsp:Transcript_5175/g.16522  ORF Transcript_5175/g.16522 Transcript_5175/m.16522 type:complete len:330 (-) Transcript_5175:184-1173(-)
MASFTLWPHSSVRLVNITTTASFFSITSCSKFFGFFSINNEKSSLFSSSSSPFFFSSPLLSSPSSFFLRSTSTSNSPTSGPKCFSANANTSSLLMLSPSNKVGFFVKSASLYNTNFTASSSSSCASNPGSTGVGNKSSVEESYVNSTTRILFLWFHANDFNMNGVSLLSVTYTSVGISSETTFFNSSTESILATSSSGKFFTANSLNALAVNASPRYSLDNFCAIFLYGFHVFFPPKPTMAGTRDICIDRPKSSFPAISIAPNLMFTDSNDNAALLNAGAISLHGWHPGAMNCTTHTSLVSKTFSLNSSEDWKPNTPELFGSYKVLTSV